MTIRHDMARIPRAELPKRTARRIANAQKAVRRELDSTPLFPELARFTTAEERLDAMERTEYARLAAIRRCEARAWFKVRRRLLQLPPDKRERFLDYWNNATMIPAEGATAAGALFHMFPRPDWYREDRTMDAPEWTTPSALAMIDRAFEEHFGDKFRREFPGGLEASP